MNDREATAKVDKLCNDAALLMYGQLYDALTPTAKDQVIAEVVRTFDPRAVDLCDSLEHGGYHAT
jgi:hypothetical protein